MIEREICEMIIQKYYDSVFNLCYSLLQNANDASDCTQEVFLLFFKKSKKLDYTEKISSWLFDTARNLVKEYNKKNPKGTVDIYELSEKLPDKEKSSFKDVISELYEILGKEDTDLLISYCEADSNERKKLADKYGIEKNALYQKIQRIRNKLKNKYNK